MSVVIPEVRQEIVYHNRVAVRVPLTNFGNVGFLDSRDNYSKAFSEYTHIIGVFVAHGHFHCSSGLIWYDQRTRMWRASKHGGADEGILYLS